MYGRPESEKAYCGSFFLMEAALEGPMARYAEGVFSRTGHGPYEVIISQVVVGERMLC